MRRLSLIIGTAFLALSLVSCRAESRRAPAAPDGDKPKHLAEPAKAELNGNDENPWDSIGVRVESGRLAVTVTEVRKDSPAEEAGVMAGDSIDKVGDNYVSTAVEFNSAVRSHKAGDKVIITRWTKGGEQQRFAWDPWVEKRKEP